MCKYSTINSKPLIRSKCHIYLFLIALGCIFLLIFGQKYNRHLQIASALTENVSKYHVLLVYVYAETHPFAFGNLEYFIRTAVRENDGAHYYFILQKIGSILDKSSHLPHLPSNAWYIYHDNECFDIGTVGWFLRIYLADTSMMNVSSHGPTANQRQDIKSYKYFIFMNSSIRGPFLPPYYFTLLRAYHSQHVKRFYWYSIFTERLTDKVKLVGCTISCQYTPHVQSYLLVTDFVGLSILMYPKMEINVFACYHRLQDVSLKSEVIASTLILKKGFSIDSLQTKYQGIDFSLEQNKNCNGGKNPYYDQAVDNITLDAYEIVFVKYNYKAYREAADRAAVYQQWNLASNVTE